MIRSMLAGLVIAPAENVTTAPPALMLMNAQFQPTSELADIDAWLYWLSVLIRLMPVQPVVAVIVGPTVEDAVDPQM